LLISTLARVTNFTGALFFLAGLSALLAASIASLPVRSHFLPETKESAPVSSGVSQGIVPYLLLFGALVFINVGTESATGGWIATYVKRLGNSPNFSWALAPSLFWAGLLAGRAVAPLALRYLQETKIVLSGMVLAVCGLLVILLNAETGIVLMGVVLTGLGLAPVFPTTLALFTQRFGAESPQLTGILFILAGLGSAFFPWVVGLLSSRFNGLHAGLFVPLLGAMMMIVLQFAIMSFLKNKERPVE
jgi:fucose permease